MNFYLDNVGKTVYFNKERGHKECLYKNFMIQSGGVIK